MIDVEGKGLAVLAGCAHSGIVNTVHYAQEISGVERVWAILGGFHLARATEEELQQTIDEIARREAAVAVARSASVPDLELGLGYRRMAGPDENALVAELRVPLPRLRRPRPPALQLPESRAAAAAHARERGGQSPHQSLGE